VGVHDRHRGASTMTDSFVRWKVHYSGIGRGLRTFLVSVVIVVVYYGILVVWF
jgi:hypothetical protein